MSDTTYRVIMLGRTDRVGHTALTPDLARLACDRGSFSSSLRQKYRLGIERTDWANDSGKPKPVRSVLIDAEGFPGEWVVGLDAEIDDQPSEPEAA
jgi:hypothetical protein